MRKQFVRHGHSVSILIIAQLNRNKSNIRYIFLKPNVQISHCVIINFAQKTISLLAVIVNRIGIKIALHTLANKLIIALAVVFVF